jgi:glycosyltransferase involved in cell wall biosynthesis
MTPRVCVVSALYHPSLGGLGRQAQLLSERLRKEGVDLFVISRKMSGMPPADFSPDVEVIRVPVLFPKTFILEEISIKNILISISFSLGLIAELIRNRKRYDLVHFHGASIPLFLSLPFLKWMDKKIVGKVAAANLGTEAGSLSGKYWFIGDFLAKRMKKVDAFIAISDEIRDGLLGDGIRPERIHRISNFVDTMIFHPPEPGEKENRKKALGYAHQTLLLFSGRLVPRKGVEFLLAAWRDVSPDFPDAILLLLGDGTSEQHLIEMAERFGISGKVRFAGRVDDVPNYLRAADIFVRVSPWLRPGSEE